MRILIPCITVALLAGCASYQQAQFEKARTAAYAQLKTDCDALFSAADISILVQKIPRNAENPTLQQLSDPSRPSEDERQAISRLNAARIECDAKGLDAAAQYFGTSYAALIFDGQKRIDALFAQLYQLQLTYGQFNTSRQKNTQDLHAALYRLQAQEQQMQAQQAEQRRQEAAAYLLAHPIQPNPIQFVPMQVNRPMQTTCYRNGPYNNCATQ